MNKHYNYNLTDPSVDLAEFFLHPSSKRQKQYEAVRAIISKKLPGETVAPKFGYSVQTVYSLVRRDVYETMPFDCKFNKYKTFDELTDAGIPFYRFQSDFVACIFVTERKNPQEKF